MSKKLKVVLIALLLATVPTISALALQGETPPANDPLVETLLRLIFGLSVTLPGVGLLVPVLVNIGKVFKIVKEDQAGLAVNILSLAFAVFIGAASLFTTWDIPGLDMKFSDLANTLTVLLPTLVLLVKWISPIFYGAIKGIPFIGYSYTLQAAKKK